MLAYIDESGYPTPGDLSPWNTLVAICTPESASRDMSRWLHASVRAAYPTTDAQIYEIKAAALLNRRQYEHSAERRRLVDDVTAVMERLPLSVFAVRARRPANRPVWPNTHVDPPHRLLIERIELHMRRDHTPDAFAKLIFDETSGGSDAARSRALRKFMHATEEGRCWSHVLDMPLFVSSHITPGIQLADLMAGALRHYQILRDANSSWLVGTRDVDDAVAFIADLGLRLANRVQITTDGHKPYIEAIERTFGRDVDYAQLIKDYGTMASEDASPTARRYSPNVVTGMEVRVIAGDPDKALISTSYVERNNLSMRMGIRRFTRLTNGFSKKVENHAAMVSLHFMYYNFGRVHKSLGKLRTPAMAGGVADHVWTCEEIAALID